MERWAKVQNAQKDSTSASGFKKPLAPISAAVKSRESATADAGFIVLSKVTHTSHITDHRRFKTSHVVHIYT